MLLNYLSTIRGALQGVHENESIEKELESFQGWLENMVGEWHAIVPIDRLKLENLDKIKIGNIWLIPFDDLESNLKSELFAIIDGSSSSTAGRKDTNKIIIEEHVVPKFKDKICACINITTADKEGLYEEALKEAENVVNLLRMYLPLFVDSDIVKIGINEGWVPPLSIICLRQDEKEFIIGNRAFKFKIDCTITNEEIERLETKYHLKDFEKILCKGVQDRSPYEKQIFTAIRWIGMGIHDDVRIDKFVKLFTALECLLVKKGEPKQEALAERCAYLLGDTQPARMAKYKQVKYLYTLRGDIVHDGSDNVTEKQLLYLKDLVISCLFKIPELPIYDKMEKKEDLINWIDSLKFK